MTLFGGVWRRLVEVFPRLVKRVRSPLSPTASGLDRSGFFEGLSRSIPAAGGVSLISPRPAPPSLASTLAAKDQRLKHLAAPGIPIDSPVMVNDLIIDGNLGQPFLTQYVVTLDLTTSRMWLAPNAH